MRVEDVWDHDMQASRLMNLSWLTQCQLKLRTLRSVPMEQSADVHERLRRLIDGQGRLILPPGGLQSMADYHFAVVKGGAPIPLAIPGVSFQRGAQALGMRLPARM